MSKRIFTREQIEELSKNKNVIKCSEKAISYNKKFKVSAVTEHEQGLTPQEIFRDAGFNLNLLGRKIPKGCLRRWSKTYRLKGKEGLEIESRGKGAGGGRPKTKNLTDSEKIKWLEAENAYLKAENDFLVKLRAKRAE